MLAPASAWTGYSRRALLASCSLAARAGSGLIREHTASSLAACALLLRTRNAVLMGSMVVSVTGSAGFVPEQLLAEVLASRAA